jgi:hypothetical protein
MLGWRRHLLLIGWIVVAVLLVRVTYCRMINYELLSTFGELERVGEEAVVAYLKVMSPAFVCSY